MAASSQEELAGSPSGVVLISERAPAPGVVCFWGSSLSHKPGGQTQGAGRAYGGCRLTSVPWEVLPEPCPVLACCGLSLPGPSTRVSLCIVSPAGALQVLPALSPAGPGPRLSSFTPRSVNHTDEHQTWLWGHKARRRPLCLPWLVPPPAPPRPARGPGSGAAVQHGGRLAPRL